MLFYLSNYNNFVLKYISSNKGILSECSIVSMKRHIPYVDKYAPLL